MAIKFSLDEETALISLLEPLRLAMPDSIPDMVVPAGYQSDGQSAPRAVWWCTGPPVRNRYIRAWIGHDYLCEQAMTWADRNFADACLAYWLRDVFGAPKLKVWYTYLACMTWGRIKFLRRSGW